jgi:hypothetical protein
MRLRLLAATLLLPALAACGNADPKAKGPSVVQQPADVIRLAGDATTKAGSARMAMVMDGPGVTMHGEGVTALGEVKGTMSMTMSVAGQTIDMEMRMLGDVIWIKMPALTAETGGKPWLELNLTELSKRADVDFEALQQFRQNDPTQSLAYLEGASDDVKEVGKEDVRGVATTKYQGTFDLSKAAKNAPTDRARKAIQSIADQLGGTTMPTTVWIDAEGRLRKMTQSIDLSKMKKAAGASGTMTVTMELFDFGVDVDVQQPPANEVGDGSVLLKGAA